MDIMPIKAPAKGMPRKRRHKQSLQVDLTPMVDLGFLLISFFIFTTTLHQATAMPLRLPANSDNIHSCTHTKASTTLTILLGSNNRIVYYEGFFNANSSSHKITNFRDIQQVLLYKKQHTHPKDLMVIVKPAATCNYKNVVDILDECSIHAIKRFCLTNITPEEARIIL